MNIDKLLIAQGYGSWIGLKPDRVIELLTEKIERNNWVIANAMTNEIAASAGDSRGQAQRTIVMIREIQRHEIQRLADIAISRELSDEYAERTATKARVDAHRPLGMA